MKSKAAFIIGSVLLLLICGCNSKYGEPVAYTYTDDRQIRMEAQASDYAIGIKSINWFVVNDSGETANFGTPYEVLQLHGKKWYHVLPRMEGENWGWEDILLSVPSGQRKGYTLDVSSLGRGTYRMVKEINGSYYAMDFEISKDGVTEEEAIRTEDAAAFISNTLAGVPAVWTRENGTTVEYVAEPNGIPCYCIDSNTEQRYSFLVTDLKDIYLSEISGFRLAEQYELPEEALYCLVEDADPALCTTVRQAESQETESGEYKTWSPAGDIVTTFGSTDENPTIWHEFLRNEGDWYAPGIMNLEKDVKILRAEWIDGDTYILKYQQEDVRKEAVYQYVETDGLPGMIRKE